MKYKQYDVVEEAGKLFSADVAKSAKKHADIIMQELQKKEKSFYVIAFSLAWISDNKGYVSMGYNSFADFVRDEYGLKKSSAYNYVKVAHRFGVVDDDGVITDIAEEYKPFDSSQLVIMENLTDDEIKQCGITADMSVRDIASAKRNYIKSLDSIGDDIASDADMVNAPDDTPQPNIDNSHIYGSTISEGAQFLGAAYTYSDFINLCEGVYALAHGMYSSSLYQNLHLCIYAVYDKDDSAGSAES